MSSLCYDLKVCSNFVLAPQQFDYIIFCGQFFTKTLFDILYD